MRGDLSVGHVNLALGALCQLVVVRHQEDRCTGRVDRLQQVHNLRGHGGIQISGRFVGENHSRLTAYRSREKSGLARARMAGDGDKFARVDFEIKA
jgi:hypothetical protein